MSPFDFGLVFIALCLAVGFPVAMLGGRIRDINSSMRERNQLLEESIQYQRLNYKMSREAMDITREINEERHRYLKEAA